MLTREIFSSASYRRGGLMKVKVGRIEEDSNSRQMLCLSHTYADDECTNERRKGKTLDQPI